MSDLIISVRPDVDTFLHDFSFQAPSWRGKLTHGAPTSLPIQFNTTNMRGKFEDRIELVFIDAQVKQRFTIVRPMRAIVGNKAELDALAPTTPYARPTWQPRAAEGEVVEGIRPPGFSEIKWVYKLREHPVPAAVPAALRVGNLDKQIESVKTTILPRELNSKTYSRHWSALLHLEEVQMT